MTANIAFSLCAALASLLIVVLAGLKGDWAVVAVYGALVLGFLARAWFGRGGGGGGGGGGDPDPPVARPPSAQVRARQLRRARFKRR